MSLDLFITDGHNLAYRCYHALAPLTNSRGQKTHALLGFIKSLRSAGRRWKPDKQVVVFDGGLSAERILLCPEYKAQRPPMPDDLRSQFPLIEQYLKLAGVPVLRMAGVEADDIIAALARKVSLDRAEAIIFSSDKDLYQLIDDYIRIVNLAKPDQTIDRKVAEEKFGVSPDQLGDWLALTGDVSDNISGVPGVGPVTATKLIKQFGSLTALRTSLSNVHPERVRLMLEKNWAVVERNRIMIRLQSEIVGLPDWSSLKVDAASETELFAFYKEMELNSLLPKSIQPDLFNG